MKKEYCLEEVKCWKVTCSMQSACEESNIGRLPSSTEYSEEAETAAAAVKEFESLGWDFDFVYEGAEYVICPNCKRHVNSF